MSCRSPSQVTAVTQRSEARTEVRPRGRPARAPFGLEDGSVAVLGGVARAVRRTVPDGVGLFLALVLDRGCGIFAGCLDIGRRVLGVGLDCLPGIGGCRLQVLSGVAIVG